MLFESISAALPCKFVTMLKRDDFLITSLLNLERPVMNWTPLTPN